MNRRNVYDDVNYPNGSTANEMHERRSPAGKLFDAISFFPNLAVRGMEKLEQSTGLENVVIGGRQNPGRGQSNIFGGFSYNSRNNNHGANSRDNGSLPLRDKAYADQSGSFQRYNHDGGTYQYYKLFAEDSPDFTAFKTFPKNDNRGAALLNSYEIIKDEVLGEEAAYRKYVEDTKSTTGFPVNEAAKMRQAMFVGAMEKTFDEVLANPRSYSRDMFTLAREYQKEVLSREFATDIKYNFKDVDSNILLAAISNTVSTDAKKNNSEGTRELHTLLKTKHGKDLEIALVNYADPARYALYSRLGPEGKQLHNDIANTTFKDSAAQAVQQAMLTNPELWEAGKGVVTDTDKNEGRVGIFIKGGQPTLTFMNGSEITEMVIPKAHWAEAFEVVGDISIRDKAGDLKPEEYLQKIRQVVEKIGNDEAKAFNNITLDYLTTKKEEVKKAEEDKKAAEEAKTTAVDEAREAATAKAEAEKQIKTSEARITSLKEEIGSIQIDIGANMSGLKALEVAGKGNSTSANQYRTNLEALALNIENIQKEISNEENLIFVAEVNLSKTETALADANKAAKEAETELVKLNPPKVEEKTAVTGGDKPELEQIKNAPDRIIAALRMTPAIAKLEEKIDVFGETIQLLNLDEKRPEMVATLNDYYNGKSGAKTPEQMISGLKQGLDKKKISLSQQSITALSEIAKDLGVDPESVKQILAKNELNQQPKSFDPKNLPHEGQAHMI